MRGLAGNPADADRHTGFQQALAEYPDIKVAPVDRRRAHGLGSGQGHGAHQQLAVQRAVRRHRRHLDLRHGLAWSSTPSRPQGKEFVPIVGADLGAFVTQLLDATNYPGLEGAAVTNTAAVGGAGVNLAAQAPQRRDGRDGPPAPKPNTVLLVPVVADNMTDEGKATARELAVGPGLDPTWPLGLADRGLDDLHPRAGDRLQGPGRVGEQASSVHDGGRRHRRHPPPPYPARAVADDDTRHDRRPAGGVGIAKTYGAVVALRNASLSVRPGEVHALMGANGAGKSTLVKILTGAIRPDGGTIAVRGRERVVHSPGEARRGGLVSVYQEPALIPDLDLRANLRLTDTPLEPFRHWMNELGLKGLDLSALGAPRAARHAPRIIDLARALAVEPDVLMLDEMTAALPANLTERVLEVDRAASRRRPVRHLHLAPHDRDRRGLRPRDGPPGGRDGRRRRRDRGLRGPDRRADARPGGRGHGRRRR